MFGRLRTPKPDTRLQIMPTSLKIILTLVVGAIISTFSIVGLNQYYKTLLIERVTTFSEAIDGNKIKQLENLNISDDKVPYQEIKDKLAALDNVYGDSRFVYIMSRTSSGDINFLADSEPTDSKDYSPRGQVYSDATDALKASFSNHQSFVEGPVKDNYGIWFSALATIYDNNKQQVAIIGADVPATNFIAATVGVGLIPIIISLITSVALYLYDRSRQRKLQALRFQSELMSVASHELQTPLHGIRWGQETLLKGSLDMSQQKLVQTMLEGTVQLEQSVENMLQLNSLQTDSTTEPLTTFDLVEIIKDATAGQILAAQQRNIQLAFDVSWPSSMMVTASAPSLRRTFSTIISGEVKNTKGNGVLRFAYSSQGDASHTIIISNSFLNLAHDKLDYIFDSSHNASNTIKGSSTLNGAGRGLFMARTTLEQYHGHLDIDSGKENIEVVIRIKLPATSSQPSTPTIS